MKNDVQAAEREVAKRKQRLQESLRVAGQAGNRLAGEVRRKITPTLVVAAVAGAAAVGVAMAIARSNSRPRWRPAQQPSVAGQVARAAGMWLLKTVALRVAHELAEKYRDEHSPALRPAHPAA